MVMQVYARCLVELIERTEMRIAKNTDDVDVATAKHSHSVVSKSNDEPLEDLDVGDGADQVIGGLRIMGDPDEGGEFHKLG
jgi:hypothetical protein